MNYKKARELVEKAEDILGSGRFPIQEDFNCTDEEFEELIGQLWSAIRHHRRNVLHYAYVE